jgi:hypothetical protein
MPRHFYVNASDVSALLGENIYKPKEEVYLDMWQRYDPVSFNTIRRQTIKPVDHAQEAIHQDDHKRHTSLKRKADVILATSTPIKEAKIQITTLIESDPILGIMPSTLQEAAVECMMYSVGTIPTITDCIRHAATTDDIESARMETALAQYIPVASSYIRSEVRTFAGCSKEQASMDVFERVSGKTVHGRNDKLYVSVLSPGGIAALARAHAPVKIGGRVDGIQEGCVIEHKQRRYRLFGYVSQRERIQLYVYMYLTGLQTGQLVETFGDKQQAHLVTFDQDVWNDYSARISDAVQELFNMLFEEDSGRRHALFSVRN